MRKGQGSSSICPRPLFSLVGILAKGEDQNSGISGLSKAHRIDTYLGLPTFVGKSRTQSFKNIIEKVSKRLENWKCSFL
jgi:hypothetical protein